MMACEPPRTLSHVKQEWNPDVDLEGNFDETGGHQFVNPPKNSHIKLFIPGPVEVSEKTFRAFCSPMVGHRGSSFQQLYAEVQPSLKQLFYTANPVFLSTSSAWGVMEAAIRNLVRPG